MIGDKKSGFADRNNKEEDYMSKERLIVYVGVIVLIVLAVVGVVVSVNYVGDFVRAIG